MGQMVSEWVGIRDEDLESTADEMLALANRLKSLAEGLTEVSVESARPNEHSVSGLTELSDEIVLKAVLAHIACRKHRARHFGSAVVGEPAWDMLLELFVSRAQGKRLSTSSLCLASGVPQSTALRVISLLQADGLLQRQQAPDDRRLTVVSITPHGYRKVRAYIVDLLSRDETHMSGRSPMRERRRWNTLAR